MFLLLVPSVPSLRSAAVFVLVFLGGGGERGVVLGLVFFFLFSTDFLWSDLEFRFYPVFQCFNL